MEKMIVTASIIVALVLSLAGCKDKESEMDKAIKESKEMSHKTSGLDQEIPRVVFKPNSPKPQPSGKK
jgi:outer membrane murein-binding lipoprotein Lpp